MAPLKTLCSRRCLALALLLCGTSPRRSLAVSFDAVRCDDGNPGMRITATHPELLSAYTAVFAVSDGSTPVLSDDLQQQQQQVRSMLNVLHMSTGLAVCPRDPASLPTPGGCAGANGTAAEEEESLLACGVSALRMAMLAAMGNFVSPLPAERGQQPEGLLATMGGEQVLPRVVVDVYSGKLALASPYGSGAGGGGARVYFLEALLVVSILAITRLVLTRNVSIAIDKVYLGEASSQHG